MPYYLHTYSERSPELIEEKLLVEAAAKGDYHTVKKLLKTGVSVDAAEYNRVLFYQSKCYLTPLQVAASNGFSNCVEILIKYGADVNAKDRFDVTATHMAAEKGNILCLKALLEAGADCTVPTKFSKSGSYTAVPHLGGTTPLHLAAANNHVECVEELIQFGADYNAIDELGRTSLFIAAQAGLENCVMAQLKNAVGRDILSLPNFSTADTPLHFAVSHGMVDCVRELLHLGSDPNHRNFVGTSPLHLAVSCPHSLDQEREQINMEILKMLVLEGYNTDINQYDGARMTPLHYVCFPVRNRVDFRRPEMAKFLIAHGAGTDIKNGRGCSLLKFELQSVEEESEVLKYVIRSILHLPRLEALKVLPPAAPPVEMLSHQPVVHMRGNPVRTGNMPVLQNAHIPPFELRPEPQDVVHALVVDEPNYFVLPPDHPYFRNLYMYRPEMRAGDFDFALARRPAEGYFHPVNLSVREPLFVPPVREGVAPPENHHPLVNPEEPDVEIFARWESSCLRNKQMWYENIASNPRTLKHYCRYAIRSCLGPQSMKHIRKLKIPDFLQSYLFLAHD